MVGRRGARAGRAAIAAVVGIALLVPAHAAASDAGSAVLLPGTTQVAVVVDLDGDGDREVLRTVAQSAASMELEAWEPMDGTWGLMASAELPTPAGADSVAFAPGPMTLIVANIEERERALVVIGGMEDAEEDGHVCCLELYQVSIIGGRLALERAGSSSGGADQLLAADLDADGTDELLTHLTVYSEDGQSATAHVRVLRRQEGEWFEIFQLDEPGHGYPAQTGETDGIPGHEILLGPSEHGAVRRLAMVGDKVVTDEVSFGTGQEFGVIVGAAAGRLVVGYPDGLETVRWPRGSTPERIHRIGSSPSYPAQVIGDGPEALIATSAAPGFRPGQETSTTTLYDIDLNEVAEIPSSPLATRLWDLIYRPTQSGAYALNRSVEPIMAPVPGGWTDGQPALVSAGSLIQPGRHGHEVTRMATLIGTQILGLAGPDSSWALVGSGMYWPIHGGHMVWGMMSDAPGVAITPVEGLLRPDEPIPTESVELRDAEVIAVDGERSELIAHGEGFEVSVTAESGSVVVMTDGALWEAKQVSTPPVDISVRPPRRSDDQNRPFERWLFVIRPDGTGSSHHWEGTFLREPPALTSMAETRPFSLRSAVAGRVSDRMTVTVDGAPAEVNRFGAFRVEVDAPIWPRDVTVVATDPFGTERTERIEVVGFLDYRGLPWIPIVGALTVALGVLLFVRTPRHRPLQLAADGDGRLEEIDGDTL